MESRINPTPDVASDATIDATIDATLLATNDAEFCYDKDGEWYPQGDPRGKYNEEGWNREGIHKHGYTREDIGNTVFPPSKGMSDYHCHTEGCWNAADNEWNRYPLCNHCIFRCMRFNGIARVIPEQRVACYPEDPDYYDDDKSDCGGDNCSRDTGDGWGGRCEKCHQFYCSHCEDNGLTFRLCHNCDH